jgi:hypothetical protein
LMMCLETLLRIYEKKFNPKKFKIKSFWLPRVAIMTNKFCYWGVLPKLKIGIL